MEKQITHKGKTARLKVWLFNDSERRPNGKQYHHAQISGSGFFEEKRIDADANLEDEVVSLETAFMNWVENPTPAKTKEEQILENIGYQKQ
jgi:hypothetical protein